MIGEEFYKHKRSFRNFKFYKTTQDYIRYMKKTLKSNNIFVMGSRYYYKGIINNVSDYLYTLKILMSFLIF